MNTEAPWHLSLAMIFASVLNFVLALIAMALSLWLAFMFLEIILYIVMSPVGLVGIIAGCGWLLWRNRK